MRAEWTFAALTPAHREAARALLLRYLPGGASCFVQDGELDDTVEMTTVARALVLVAFWVANKILFGGTQRALGTTQELHRLILHPDVLVD